MKVKNVIIVCDYGFIDGGAARVAHETAIVLSNSDINITFFCGKGPISKELTNSNIRVVCLNQNDILLEQNKLKAVSQGLNNKLAKKVFEKLLDEFVPEETIIHVHTWTKVLSSSIFIPAKKQNFKVLITVHDYFLVCPNGGLFNYKKSKICNLSPMSAKCVFSNCDSRSYAHKLFRLLRQRRQNRNINNNKNISYAFISEFSKCEFLKRYNVLPGTNQYFLPNLVIIDKNRFRIECERNQIYLFIGGITEIKGIRIFCEAVKRANVPAVVIGDGILRKELEEMYPEIEFVGWKSKQEMMPYLEKARCFIFSSIWYETMGLTPIEVMVYGIPVICSKLNAASEYVIGDMLYDGTLEGLLQKIYESQSDTTIEKISKMIFTEFSIEQYSQDSYCLNLIHIYNSLI